MAEESAVRSGSKTILVLVLIGVVFAILFIAGYWMNEYKRGVSTNAANPTSVNGNYSTLPAGKQ
jgi:hypothetical protein